MTLLDAEPLPPPSPWPKRLAAAALLLGVAAGVLYWQFRHYPEKKQVERFMEALKAGDYQGAYQLWKPTPTYSFRDFLADWGETTSFGRIHSYEVVGVESPRTDEIELVQGGQRRTVRIGGGSSGVVVSVRINGQEEPVHIWVEKKDKSLSFPPF